MVLDFDVSHRFRQRWNLASDATEAWRAAPMCLSADHI